nr:hypothetical protein [Tanacetum cinerariifolium]
MSDGHVVHDAQHPDRCVPEGHNARTLKNYMRTEKCLRLENISHIRPITQHLEISLANSGRGWIAIFYDTLTLTERLENIDGDSQSERNPGKTTAFSSSMLSALPDLISQHFPSVISISKNLGGVPYSILIVDEASSVYASHFGFQLVDRWPNNMNTEQYMYTKEFSVVVRAADSVE